MTPFSIEYSIRVFFYISKQVYGWEPARTYDTLIMGWGKIRDLSVCDSQLIAGGLSLTNVSVYVVDLKKVQPFTNPMPSKQIYSRDSPSRYALSIMNCYLYLRTGISITHLDINCI